MTNPRRTACGLFRRLAALAVAAALLLSPVSAAAGTARLTSRRDLMDGLAYVNAVSDSAAGRVESFSLEYVPGQGVEPVALQGSGTIYGAASISRAVENAQALGYHVLGAVNADFFSTATGVPMGISIEDGVYKSSPEGECAVAVTDGAFSLVESPRVEMTLTNLSNPDASAPLTVQHLNKYRAATGGLYLFSEDFSSSTHTNTTGWMVRLRSLGDGKLTVSGTLQLQVAEVIHTAYPWDIGEGEYILTADDVSGYGPVLSAFQTGDLVTLETKCSSPQLLTAQWAFGAGDVMVRSGALTDSSSWTYAKDGRNPRTALGVRSDGSALLYVADGRQSGYSSGLSQTDLAEELLQQGCSWAVNLDGGGSSAMSVWIPGQSGPSLVNRPSDGSARACATYLLFVSDDAGDGVPSRLALDSDGLAVLAGSSAGLGSPVVLDSALNPLQAETGDVVVYSGGLGTVDGSVYTAGSAAGTDTLTLYDPVTGAQGSAQVQVVGALTELKILRSDSSAEAASLTVENGEQVRLTAQGTWWGRVALRDGRDADWSVQGDIGYIDDTGLFTAVQGADSAGTITVSAGGLTATVPVTLRDAHTDVGPDHWAYEAVNYCYGNGLVTGLTDTEFGPENSLRRGDFVLMLYRAAGSPAAGSCTFTDVSGADYYAAALAWGQENGLVAGMEDGSCHPAEAITREAAFTILHRALPLLGVSCGAGDGTALAAYADAPAVSSWAAEHVAALVSEGIVSGSGGYLHPQSSLSRAEMAQLLFNLSLRASSEEDAGAEDAGESEPALPDGQDPEDAASGDSEKPGWLGGGSDSGDSSRLDVDAVSPEDAVLEFETAGSVVPGATTGVVNVSGTLNVRAGPGTGYEAVDSLSGGAKVLLLSDEEDGWLHVRYTDADGFTRDGYVAARYVEIL